MKRAGSSNLPTTPPSKNLTGGNGRKRMIRFYFHPTPDPAKVALMLEETSLAYQLMPIDTSKGEQHTPACRRGAGWIGRRAYYLAMAIRWRPFRICSVGSARSIRDQQWLKLVRSEKAMPSRRR